MVQHVKVAGSKTKVLDDNVLKTAVAAKKLKILTH